MMMEHIPVVVQVVPGEAYCVYAYFDDGSVHLYDVAPLIKQGTVFEPLADVAVFRKSLTVMNRTLAFDIAGNRNPYDCIDIDPETVYGGKAVADPLEAIA
ncbi:DUF2442 domain-containing protein [Selenomonas sp.]|jgi:hypothetical protein|uniref:DUF2442 domain-containing protein n=1 Tax=Selenomonas sp. TaxID=2053611 RepID=UPI0025FA3E3E|nr:DUF2442 domain-containing protein [Selenomonas sp.]MBQ1866866.1 DUF2442 domain-containing protein [Selenomonas sp.]MCI7331595.1 DUF2442 domain-containing protein [Selenomonadaceae bacterium]MDD7056137.1 DUF2442 domain-containing protein [Selenomonadaceae bacterium]MDY3917171.1 DUF2442 domain-containing protein [Selenomonadaceae bacterium]